MVVGSLGGVMFGFAAQALGALHSARTVMGEALNSLTIEDEDTLEFDGTLDPGEEAFLTALLLQEGGSSGMPGALPGGDPLAAAESLFLSQPTPKIPPGW